MKEKNEIVRKIKYKKLILAMFLIAFVFVCIGLQLTPLMKVFWFKVILERIIENKWNIWFISIVLIIMHYVEKRRFFEQIENIGGDKRNE